MLILYIVSIHKNIIDVLIMFKCGFPHFYSVIFKKFNLLTIKYKNYE